MNNSLCLGVVSQRIIRAVATAVLLYGYRRTVGWRAPIFRFFFYSGSCFSYLVVKSAPSGKDWINGGTGRTKLEAISIAKKIAQKIPKGKDFEVYVDYHDDGSFTVYYRLVK